MQSFQKLQGECTSGLACPLLPERCAVEYGPTWDTSSGTRTIILSSSLLLELSPSRLQFLSRCRSCERCLVLNLAPTWLRGRLWLQALLRLLSYLNSTQNGILNARLRWKAQSLVIWLIRKIVR